MPEIDPVIHKAIETINNFIKETTGQEPTPEEIAGALKRYFVLNEIKSHIEMERGKEEENLTV